MTASKVHPADAGNGLLATYEDEVGFLVLGLAQLVAIFAVWFGSWPSVFGMPQAYGTGFAVFFLCAGVFGFYLAFRLLSV